MVEVGVRRDGDVEVLLLLTVIPFSHGGTAGSQAAVQRTSPSRRRRQPRTRVLMTAVYCSWKANTRSQSFFMLTTVQP